MNMLFIFFFFSSRRRHTRWPRDWSSDVCSSDLTNCAGTTATFSTVVSGTGPFSFVWRKNGAVLAGQNSTSLSLSNVRSEERRVGKECRCGRGRSYEKEKNRSVMERVAHV